MDSRCLNCFLSNIGVKKSPDFSRFLILEKLDYIPGSQIIRSVEEVKALREKAPEKK